MKILVPLKRVPDPDTRIRLKPDGSGVDLEGVKFTVNPFDAIALQEALRLEEKLGEIEIVVVSIGGDECIEPVECARGGAAGARAVGSAGGARSQAERRRSLRQVPVPRSGRPCLRGSAHPARHAALQRVPLVASRLRARLQLLRDRPAGLPAQPRGLGDGRAGAARPARVARAADHGCRVPGPGRAAPELRQCDAGGARAARPVRRADRPRPHHHLDGGPAAPDRALHRGGPPVPPDPLAHLRVLREAGAARPAHGALRRPRARLLHAAPRRGEGGAGQPRLGPDLGLQHGPRGGEGARPPLPRRERPPVGHRLERPHGGLRSRLGRERGRFLSALSENGLGFVRRYSGGPDIDAACGMLASRSRGGAVHEPPASTPS